MDSTTTFNCAPKTVEIKNLSQFSNQWQWYINGELKSQSENLSIDLNSGIYDVNTIANYDKAIIYYLKMPFGTEMERIPGEDKFRKVINNE